MSNMQDTIVAISSPPGRSMRGLVRISGPQTRTILQAIVGNNLPPVREMTAIRLKLPSASEHDNAMLPLPALLMHLSGPGSYTGQDMAEIQCPGHPALLQRLVKLIISYGARMAEPGEFTFRSFLAGKLDLTQAEGVAATISAQSDAQLQAASLLREGHLGKLASRLVDTLGDALAAVEAGIDFTDQDDVRPISAEALDKRLSDLLAEMDRTLIASRNWGKLDALPAVVLVGLPSVGKSTLFNALLGRERSVISPQPGTTRDILAEPLSIQHQGQKMQVMLTDIAGLDNPLTAMDHLVQQTARHAIAQADILLCVGDHENPPPAVHDTHAVMLPVRTKADLPPTRPVSDQENPVVAPTGQGLEELRQAIARSVDERGISHTGQMLALQPRHELAFVTAMEHLKQAREFLALQHDRRGVDQPELVASSMRLALDELAGLGGQLSPDDVIGRVFAKFCIGK